LNTINRWLGALDSEPSWRTVDKIVICACVALCACYGILGHLDYPAERIRGSDSIGYYVYLPSLLLQGDLDLAEDFQTLGGKDIFLFPAKDGLAGNPYAIGTAVLWSPWFLLGHLIAGVSSYATDGYSAPYFFLVYWGNALYVLVGLLILVRLLRSFDLSANSALIATLCTLLATQLTYYIFPLSATSHGASFASTAAFLLSARRTGLSWQTGLLGGLSALLRWQNILILSVVALVIHLTDQKRLTLDRLRSYLPFAICAVLAMLPQMAVWQTLYGQPFTVPQLEGYVDPLRFPTLKILFSLRHGLITWHPLWLLAGAGIFLLRKRHRPWAIAIGVLFCLQLYTNGTVRDWWGEWSFGHRRFVNLLPLFAIGIAVLAEELSEHRRSALLGVCVFLLLWNQAFIFQYQRALIPRSHPPTWTEFAKDKFMLGRVWRAQLAVNTAVQSFRRSDFASYLEFAHQAAHAHPEFRNTRKVVSVARLTEGHIGSALNDFEAWLEIEPWSRAARWGIADIRVKLGQLDQAKQEMASLGLSVDAFPPLASGKGTLLTPEFFQVYLEELGQIYTE